MANLYNHKALSFNDILLVPQYSDVESRLKTDVSTYLTPKIKLDIPIISTNMSTVTESKMAATMSKLGGAGFLHRFLPLEETLKMIKETKEETSLVIPSIGVKDDDYDIIKIYIDLGIKIVLLDIAHADSLHCYKMADYIKKNNLDLIFGNIATSNAVQRAIDHGADSVRVGIAGGSTCATKFVTGHGVPLLQSIIDCSEVCKKHNISLIADGGIKNSGDCVKALVFGADICCVGGLLAGTSDSPGEIIHIEDKKYKEYYGMSSTKAQDKFKGGLKRGTASEGFDKMIPYQGNTEDVVNEIVGGIRSGLTYSGARTIQELRDNAEYIILAS